MKTRILVVLLMACGCVGLGCERNGQVRPPVEGELGSSESSLAPGSTAAPKTSLPTEAASLPEAQTDAVGEPTSNPSDPVDESAEATGEDSDPGAGDNGTTPSDPSAESDQPMITIYNRTQGEDLPWMTMPAYTDQDGRLIKHGLVSEVSEAGVLRVETNWTHGKKDGVYRTWYENGVLAQQGEFSMGNQIGTWNWWYSNGKLDRQGSFNEKNERHGMWTYWDRQEVLVRQETWVNGVKQLGD